MASARSRARRARRAESVRRNPAETLVTGARVLFGAMVVVEGVAALARHRDRSDTFARAEAQARALGRPLVVVGDPFSGAHTRLMPAYGCGNVCLDLTGCPACPVGHRTDLARDHAPVGDDTAVVFCLPSCDSHHWRFAAKRQDELGSLLNVMLGNWDGQRVDHRPPAQNSLLESHPSKPEVPQPLGLSFEHAVDGNEFSRARVTSNAVHGHCVFSIKRHDRVLVEVLKNRCRSMVSAHGATPDRTGLMYSDFSPERFGNAVCVALNETARADQASSPPVLGVERTTDPPVSIHCSAPVVAPEVFSGSKSTERPRLPRMHALVGQSRNQRGTCDRQNDLASASCRAAVDNRDGWARGGDVVGRSQGCLELEDVCRVGYRCANNQSSPSHAPVRGDKSKPVRFLLRVDVVKEGVIASVASLGLRVRSPRNPVASENVKHTAWRQATGARDERTGHPGSVCFQDSVIALVVWICHVHRATSLAPKFVTPVPSDLTVFAALRKHGIAARVMSPAINRATTDQSQRP